MDLLARDRSLADCHVAETVEPEESAFERIKAGPVRLAPPVPETNSFMAHRKRGANGTSSGPLLFHGEEPTPADREPES